PDARGDGRLDEEEGQCPQGYQRCQEGGQVKGDTGHVGDRPGEAHQQPRVKGCAGLGSARGNALQDRCDSVGQSGEQRASQAQNHASSLPARQKPHAAGVGSRESWLSCRPAQKPPRRRGRQPRVLISCLPAQRPVHTTSAGGDGHVGPDMKKTSWWSVEAASTSPRGLLHLVKPSRMSPQLVATRWARRRHQRRVVNFQLFVLMGLPSLSLMRLLSVAVYLVFVARFALGLSVT